MRCIVPTISAYTRWNCLATVYNCRCQQIEINTYPDSLLFISTCLYLFLGGVASICAPKGCIVVLGVFVDIVDYGGLYVVLACFVRCFTVLGFVLMSVV